MGTRAHPLTPLAAVAGGALAGAVGTAAMDAVLYARYRRSGGQDAPMAWEFPPIGNWEQASAPGQVAKRVIEGFTQRPIPGPLGPPQPPSGCWPRACNTPACTRDGRTAGSVGREEVLQLFLDVLGGDEEQLVAGLQRVLGLGDQHPSLAQDGD